MQGFRKKSPRGTSDETNIAAMQHSNNRHRRLRRYTQTHFHHLIYRTTNQPNLSAVRTLLPESVNWLYPSTLISTNEHLTDGFKKNKTMYGDILRCRSRKHSRVHIYIFPHYIYKCKKKKKITRINRKKRSHKGVSSM